jgi:hypothetical protein
MKPRTTIASIVGALALAAAAAYAPAASADRVGFNVTFGGPGYAVNVGNAGFGYYDAWRPAPVVVAPYAPYYRPYRSYYRPYYAPVVVPAPVVVRPYPVYRPYQGYRQDWRRHDRPVGYVQYER